MPYLLRTFDIPLVFPTVSCPYPSVCLCRKNKASPVYSLSDDIQSPPPCHWQNLLSVSQALSRISQSAYHSAHRAGDSASLVADIPYGRQNLLPISMEETRIFSPLCYGDSTPPKPPQPLFVPSPHQMERQSLHYIHLLYMTFSTSHGEKLTDFNSA